MAKILFFNRKFIYEPYFYYNKPKTLGFTMQNLNQNYFIANKTIIVGILVIILVSLFFLFLLPNKKQYTVQPGYEIDVYADNLSFPTLR